MPETRDRQIMVNIENTFYEVLQELANKENNSISGFVRSLIIQDLRRKGLIDDGVIFLVTIGKTS
jgi:predicted DNA-binding ribbon-helix-helix protein